MAIMHHARVSCQACNPLPASLHVFKATAYSVHDTLACLVEFLAGTLAFVQQMHTAVVKMANALKALCDTLWQHLHRQLQSAYLIRAIHDPEFCS